MEECWSITRTASTRELPFMLAVQQGKAGSAYTYVCMYRREIEASQSVGRQMMPSDRAATPIALAVAAFDEWTLDLCQTDNDS